MGNSFTSGNNIYVHTEQPGYVSGSEVKGLVYLSINNPVNSKGVYLKVTGYEKTWWEEHYYETVQDGDQQRQERRTREHIGRSDFFKCKVPVYTVQGTLSPGQYQFPFSFYLPQGLPTSFKESGTHGDGKFHCSVTYKLKAECDVSGFMKSNIKHKQDLIVNERLNQPITNVSKEGRSDITQCCCINKGNACMKVHLDKNSYVPGETAQIVCEVENKSTIKLPRIKVKLMRKLTMEAKHGHKITDKTVLAQEDYQGVDEGESFLGPQARRLPLQLISNRSREKIQPETHGKLINCHYWCEVELDVPMGSDVAIDVPVVIYAPQPAQGWALQAPPGWNPQVMPSVAVNVTMMAPPPIVPSPMGYQAPPQQQGYQAPPYQTYQNVPPMGYQQQPNEKTSLVGGN